MSWVKIPDSWLESDRIEALGGDAVLLHLSALSVSSRQRSDGHIAVSALRRLWPVSDLADAIKALSDAGEWEQTADGYYLTNWRDHLLSAAEIDHRREVSRETSERYRRHKAGDHSMCERCSVVRRGDTSRDASVTPSVTPLVTSRLDSSRSEARETRREPEEGRGPDSAGATSTRAHAAEVDSDGYSCTGCGLPAHHPIHESVSA